MNALRKEHQEHRPDTGDYPHLATVKPEKLPKRPKKSEALRRKFGATALAALMLVGVGKGAMEVNDAIKDKNAVEQTNDAEIAWTEQGSKTLRQLNGTVTLSEGVRVYGYPDNGSGKEQKPNNLLTVIERGTALVAEYPSYVDVNGVTWMAFEYGEHPDDATKAEKTAWVAIEQLGDQKRNSDGKPFFEQEFSNNNEPFFDEAQARQSGSHLVEVPHEQGNINI